MQKGVLLLSGLLDTDEQDVLNKAVILNIIYKTFRSS